MDKLYWMILQAIRELQPNATLHGILGYVKARIPATAARGFIPNDILRAVSAMEKKKIVSSEQRQIMGSITGLYVSLEPEGLRALAWLQEDEAATVAHNFRNACL